MANLKLAILVSHPIHYQVHLFRKLAQQPEIDLTVYFCSDAGAIKPHFDPEFEKEIQWDIPSLDGYRHKFLKNYSLRPSVFKFLGQINPRVIRELKKNKYDLLFLHGWNSFTNWLAIITALILKIPVGMHGDNSLMSEKEKPIWKIKIKKIILGNLFKKIHVFFYMGLEDKKFYEFYGVPERKLIFMPYATDNEMFFQNSERLSSQKDLLRKKININPKGTVIVFVGKLIERKRPVDLIKAYELISKNNQVSLVFVGDGPLRGNLEKRILENKLDSVRLAGFKNVKEISQFYALADIFVIPSSNEVWGIVVNEAMCFGLPIVASNTVGSTSDLVSHNENGFVYPEGDIRLLSQYLRALIENEEQRIAFGKKSLEIIGRYSYEADVRAILNFLENKPTFQN